MLSEYLFWRSPRWLLALVWFQSPLFSAEIEKGVLSALLDLVISIENLINIILAWIIVALCSLLTLLVSVPVEWPCFWWWLLLQYQIVLIIRGLAIGLLLVLLVAESVWGWNCETLSSLVLVDFKVLWFFVVDVWLYISILLIHFKSISFFNGWMFSVPSIGVVATYL